MYKSIILIFLATFAFAANPKAYSVLGDIIYDNVENIEKLKNIEVYSGYKDEISQYVANVKESKKKGFKLESTKDSELQKDYLKTLRELSKKNDFFIRSVQTNYNNSIENEDNLLFSQVINSGLIDTKSNKEEIIDYYFKHEDDLNTTGVIQTYLEADAKLKENKNAKVAKSKSKKILEEEKIKRFRKNDMEAQKNLEKKLQEEVDKKKLEIRQNQKIELKQ